MFCVLSRGWAVFSGVVGSPVTVQVTSEEGLPANMVKMRLDCHLYAWKG